MDDETFDKFIAYDDGSDSEKENDETPRQPKTSQNQFDMIASFMKNNNEELIHKDVFGHLWENLATNLNNIGPPLHTIWSSHKYYKNRKRLSNASSSSENPAKTSRSNESPQVESVEIGGATSEVIPIQSEGLVKLDVIIANQNRMIANQTEMIRNQNVLVNELKSLVQMIAKRD